MSVPNWRDAVLPPGATIGEAIAALDRSGFQIVLVADGDGRLLGTITDGDIRRGLLRGKTLDSAVEDIAHREPMVVPPGVASDAALQLMAANKIRQLPIIDPDRRIAGLHVWDELRTPAERPNLMVVMAGGKGTRLRPQTESCPKPLLPVGGRPILEHVIERARRDGIRRFLFSVHYLAHMIEDHFGDGSAFGVEIDYLREEAPLGTGGALSLITQRPGVPFVVSNGDVMTDVGYGEIIDYHVRHGAAATMAVRSHELRNPFGVVRTDGLDIAGFEEKPVVRSLVNAGIYVIDPSALDCLTHGEHCDMPALFERLRAQERRTIVFPLHERWLDVGRPDDLEQARRTLAGT